MSLASDTSTITFTLTGSTVTVPVPFRFFDATDLAVTVNGIAQTLGTDYTVSGAGDDSGGSVTFPGPMPGATVEVVRTVALTQPTSFRAQGNFSPSVHEDAFDRAVMGLQQLERDKVDGTTTDALNTRVTSLETSRTADESILTEHTSELSSHETRLGTLETDDTTHETHLENIDARVGALEQNGDSGLVDPGTNKSFSDPANGVKHTLGGLNLTALTPGYPVTPESVNLALNAIGVELAAILASNGAALQEDSNTFTGENRFTGLLESLLPLASSNTADDWAKVLDLSFSDIEAGLYRNKSGIVAIVSGAVWVQATGWNKDAGSSNAAKLQLNRLGLTLKTKADISTPWADTAWDSDTATVTGADAAFSNASIEVFRGLGTAMLSLNVTVGSTALTAGTWYSLGTIPAGFRPVAALTFKAGLSVGTSHYEANISVATTGEITLMTHDTATGTAQTTASVSFPLGA